MSRTVSLPRLTARLPRLAGSGARASLSAALRRLAGEFASARAALPPLLAPQAAAIPSPAKPKPLNLALQGGGAHGAFTWGVLDRLLEDGRIGIQSVSGTSAGAMNAVAMACGLMDGGAPFARERMGEFWRAVSNRAHYSPLRPHPLDPRRARDGRVSPTGVILFDLMTRLVSPYQFNPLDFNPLRDVLEEIIDFKRLRQRGTVDLHIAATDVATGKPRIFRTNEISADAVLASACLPQLHKAVKVGRRHYWDGGFSANPPILPLVETGQAADTLIVQIDPSSEPDVPTNARAIIARVNRLTFNQPLRREVETIEHLRALAADGWVVGGTLRKRIGRHRFHHIEAGDLSRELGHSSRLSPEWDLLCRLRDMGRAAAEAWLKRNLGAVGDRSTVDLAAKFL
jgi:NTE family protein